MAGPRGRAEEVRERGEARPGDASAEDATRERDGVHDRRREALPGDALCLAVEEREVEAGVVRDEDGVASKREEQLDGARDGRRAPKLAVP